MSLTPKQRGKLIFPNFHGTSAIKILTDGTLPLSYLHGLPLLELLLIVIVSCLTSSHKNYLSTWLCRFSGDTPVVGCIATEPLVFPIVRIAYVLPSLLRNQLNHSFHRMDYLNITIKVFTRWTVSHPCAYLSRPPCKEVILLHMVAGIFQRTIVCQSLNWHKHYKMASIFLLGCKNKYFFDPFYMV